MKHHKICTCSVLYKQGSMSPKTPNPISLERLIKSNSKSNNIRATNPKEQTRRYKPEGNIPEGNKPEGESEDTIPKATNRSGEGPKAQYWTPLTGGMCHNSQKGIRKVVT